MTTESGISDTMRQEHHNCIRQGWPTFARDAYDGFLKDGRGVVVISGENFDYVPHGQALKIKALYAGEREPACKSLLAVAAKSYPEVARWISDYDPEREVLFIFMGDPQNKKAGTGVHTYRVNGIPGHCPKDYAAVDGGGE